MTLFVYFFGVIDLFLNIGNETKDYYFRTMENIYHYDFKLSYSIFIEILPELLLLFFIFYSLINLFNDKNNSIFQYYKWFFYYLFILFLLLFKFIGFKYFVADLFFGFTWLNSYFTLVSKIFILGLTLFVLLISQVKIKYFSKLNYFIEFPLVIGFSVLFLLYMVHKSFTMSIFFT